MSTDVKIIIGMVIVAAVFFGFLTLNKNRFQGQIGANKTPVNVENLIRDDSDQIGPKDSKVTIVEFADFECEACGAAHPTVKRILEEYKGKIRFVRRHFPLPGHANAILASQVAEAAEEQGKFWEMHNKLYESQIEWGEKQESEIETFIQYATDLGLDIEQFKQSIESNKAMEKINRDKADGEVVGVRATPTFFINGQMRDGVPDYQQLKNEIDGILAGK